jgi:hypothetical protein
MIEASPDEMPFTRRKLRKDLERLGLCVHEIVPFDFMYPLLPERLVGFAERVGAVLEAIPVVREIAGSLLVLAQKRG